MNVFGVSECVCEWTECKKGAFRMVKMRVKVTVMEYLFMHQNVTFYDNDFTKFGLHSRICFPSGSQRFSAFPQELDESHFITVLAKLLYKCVLCMKRQSNVSLCTILKV